MTMILLLCVISNQAVKMCKIVLFFVVLCQIWKTLAIFVSDNPDEWHVGVWSW